MPTGSTRSPYKVALRLLGKALLASSVALFALVVGLACFAVFPPADLLRRGALPLVREALGHENLHIGKLQIRPLSGLELGDVWLGAPAGYREPLLTVRRVVVRWDLSRILDQQVRVLQLQVERPLVRVESRKGKLSWIAFLENMPKSEPKPEEVSEPSKLQILMDRVSIIGLGAAVDDGKLSLALDSLHLALHGLWSEQRSDLHLALRVERRTPGKPNLALVQRVVPALEADLGADLDLDVRVQQVHQPRGSVDLKLDLASSRLKAPWKLKPVKLALALSASGDLPKEKARVQRLGLTFNGAELLRLRGALAGLTSSRDLDMVLTRLHLPLDRLAPYVKALVKGVDFGGTVEVNDLKVAGPVDSMSSRLPRLSGVISARKVWALVQSKDKQGKKGKPMRVKDLDLRLAVSSAGKGQKTVSTYSEMKELLPDLAALPSPEEEDTQQTGPGKPALPPGKRPGPGKPALPPGQQPVLPASVQGWVTLGSFSGVGARVRDLDLRLAAGAALDGFSPRQVAGRIRLAAPGLSYYSPATGRINASLRTTVEAGGDVRAGNVTLDRLALSVSNLLRLSASGKVSAWGNQDLSARVKLAPLDLKRLWAWLPAKLRAPMPALKLRGTVGLDLRASGRLPASGTSPLRAPLKVKARVKLDRVAMSDRKLKLAFIGLGGTVDIRGKPTDLRLETRLRLAALSKTDTGLMVQGVALPLRARVTPRGVTAKVGLTTTRVLMKSIKLATRGLHLDLGLRSAMPVHRLILGRRAPLGKTSLDLTAGFETFQLNAPANRITVGKERTRVKLDYVPGRGTVLDFETNIASFGHARQGITARGVRMTFKDRSSGLGRIVLPKPKLKLRGLNARHTLTLGVKHLDYGALGLKVRGLTLDQKGDGKNFTMFDDGRVHLDRVAAKVTIGVGSLTMRGLIRRALRNNRVEVDLSARGLRPVPKSFNLRRLAVRLPTRGLHADLSGRAGNVVPFSPTRLPEFDVTLSAGVKNRPGGRGRATFLWPEIHGSGKAGVSLRLRRAAADRVRLDGRLGAGAFNLWTEKKGSPARLHLADIDANVPISQEVVLTKTGWKLPAPKKLISARGASVLYNTMRPYRKGRSAFSMGGLTMVQDLGKGKTRKVKLDRVSLDLAIRDNALLLSRMYIKLFGGDIVGAVQAQARSLVPFDPILLARTQITGVKLDYLDPRATTISDKTEVSAMVDMRYQPHQGKLEGRVNITRLSLTMLRSLLVAIDPAETNVSVQMNRKFLDAWYAKLADPKIKLVSIWISHGNLNMDIRLDAWFVVGTILKKIVKDMRIRRVNILPLLRQHVSPHLRKTQQSLEKLTGMKYKDKGAGKRK